MKDGGQLYAGCWLCRSETTARLPMRLSALGEPDGGAASGVRPLVAMNRDGNVRYPEPGTRKAGKRLLQPPSCDAGSRRAGRPTWVERVCLLTFLFEGRHMGAPELQWHWCQPGAGQPPVAAIATDSHDALGHGPDTVTQSVAGHLPSRQGTSSSCAWLHVPCNAWATERRSTPSSPFDSLGRIRKYPQRW